MQEHISEVSDKKEKDYFCSITLQMFYKPVLASDGCNYEEEAIIEWASNHDLESPLRMKLNTALHPNIPLKNEIDEYLQKHPEKKSEQYVPKNPSNRNEIGYIRAAELENKHDVEMTVHTPPSRHSTIVAMPVDESLPLLTNNTNRPSRSSNKLNDLGAQACALCSSVSAVGGVISVFVFLLTRKSNGQPITDKLISYEFKTPYAGGGTLIVHNQNDFDISISNIQFYINGIIDTAKQGSIYGDLAPWGKAKIANNDRDGVWYGYNVIEPNDDKIWIPAKSQKNFTYVFEKPTDVLNVVSMPKNISITNVIGDVIDLPLNGQCQDIACDDPVPGKILSGYYTNWDMYARQFNVEDIPIEKINEINYAFLKFDTSGNITSLDFNSDNIQLPMLMQLNQRYPYLNVVMSVGGYGLSDNFSNLAANPTAVENFAENLVAILRQFNFKGVDVDWEYVLPEDAHNFVAMLKTIRTKMDASGQNYTLSIAAPAGSEHINAIGSLWQEVMNYVNHLKIMGYDGNGPWAPRSDYQSPFSLPPNDPNGQQNSLNATIALYKSYGVKPENTVVGIPAYFRGVVVNNTQNYGLWQPVVGTPNGQFDNTGLFSNACVFMDDCRQGNSFPKDAIYVSADNAPYGNYSKTPLVYQTQNNLFFTGDSYESTAFKTQFAKENNFKGVFFWTFADDVRNDNSKSVIHAAYTNFKSANNTSVNLDINKDSSNIVFDENTWHEFISGVQKTIVGPMVGGFVFSIMFHLLQKMTDESLKIVLKQVPTLSKENSANLYYGLKTAIYFGSLYLIGVPLLPSSAALMTSCLCQKMLNFTKENVQISALLTSFAVNMAQSTDVSYTQALVTFLSAFISSNQASQLVDPKTPTLRQTVCSFYQLGKDSYQRASTFMQRFFYHKQVSKVQEAIELEVTSPSL